MSYEINKSFSVPAPVDRVGQALCSEDYALAGAMLRDDIESASYHITGEEAAGLEYEVRYVEFARTKTGKINRAKTSPARARSVWDAEARTLRWQYTTDASDRIRLEGVYRLTPEGAGTHVDYSVVIEVRVPVVGNKIAKMVGKGVEGDMTRLQALLAEHATRPS